MDVERLAKELILKGMTSEQQKAVLNSIKSTMTQAREVQKQRIGENVQVVVQALKKIEGDIRSRYDEVGNKIEKRVASIKDGQDGRDGKDGKDGKDGRPGRDGSQGPKGTDGLPGRDGQDGQDGVSVTDAHIDFDGSLTITLSNGREINVGEVVAPDLAERIKVITNGGGTSQGVLDTLDSLQTQIDTLIPSQTGNAGKYLTTNGTATSWATVGGGGGGVTSVTGTSPVVSSGGTTPAISLAAAYGDTLNPYASKTANFVLAAPNGSAGTPTFRAVVAADIPTLNQNTTGTAANVTGTVAIANGGTGATTLAGASIATYAGAETLTNKRINPRVSTAASTATLTPNISSFDQYNLTAQLEGLTVAAPTGTPLDGNKLIIRVVDNGTTRSITWNSIYKGIGVTLPTATTANKTLYVGCIYNAYGSTLPGSPNVPTWDVIAVTIQT